MIRINKNKSAINIPVCLMALLVYFIPCQKAHAYEYQDDELASKERFNLRLGAFIISDIDTTARFDSTTVPVGTVIDLEDNFNLNSSDTVLRLDGFYRLNKAHRIDWTIYNSHRDGTSITDQTFIIGDPDDPDGIDIIPVGATVTTRWNLDLLKIGYAWSFINNPEYEWYIGAGLNIHSLEADISYEATINTFDDKDRIDAKADIPLPTFSIGGRYRISHKWQSNVHYELFFLKLGDYQGLRQEFMLNFEHNTFKNIGFGVGLNIVDLDIKANKQDFRGEFDSSIFGLLGYMKFYF